MPQKKLPNPDQPVPQQSLMEIKNYFAHGIHPFESVTFERRDALIEGTDGKLVFEQRDVSFPTDWSQNATNIVAQKYFSGQLGSEDREWSVKQLIGRVVEKIGSEGLKNGYFDNPLQQQTFEHELAHILVHQMAAFNSPVWFNVGVEGVPQQGSACFILHIEDSLEDITRWYAEEAKIFQNGSGAGLNLSALRASEEPLSRGGYSSGPVTFMRAADASAGTITSGGRCLAPEQMVYTATGPISVKKLADNGEDFVIFSYDPPARRYKAKTARAWKQPFKKQLVQIRTDKGSFKLSADHPVRLSTGSFVEAGQLTAGQSLFAGTISYTHDGYLRIGLKDGLKTKARLHRLVAEDILGKDITGMSVHHIDENPFNNTPSNLDVMTQSEHATLHGRRTAELGNHIFQHKSFPRSGADNPMHSESDFWNDADRVVAYKGLQSKILLNDGDRASKMQHAAAQQKMLNTAFKILNSGYSIDNFEDYVAGRKELMGHIPSIKKLRETIDQRFGSYDAFLRQVAANNHRVIEVSLLAESEVYDVEVDCPTADDKSADSGHNFLIWDSKDRTGSGIVVSNTRRAAKLIALDVDHPDIEYFIWCKADEEKKARALAASGFDMSLNTPEGERNWASLQYQNANNSVRLSDEFLKAVEADADFELTARKSGEPVKTVKARDLLYQMADAAWECADPGVQYDTTINSWHTCPNHSRITASNPCCFTGETLVDTVEGKIRFDELERRSQAGEEMPYALAWDTEKRRAVLHRIKRAWIAGQEARIIEVETDQGIKLQCTPEHRFLTHSGEYVEAQKLTFGTQLRISGGSLGKPTDQLVNDSVSGIRFLEEKATVYDLEVEGTHNFAVTSGDAAHSIIVHNSEYMHVDNSSCNLASLNLMKFRSEDGSFNVESFQHAVRVMFTAQEILISFADYPTPEITKNTHQMRQIGMGYSNLGAYLMASGIPYDSDEGRDIAGAITALTHCGAYSQSARIAERMGPYQEFQANQEAQLRVIRRHRTAANKLNLIDGDPGLTKAAKNSGKEMVELAEQHGVRNSQATVSAPAGTISFLMDCDTTGVEPDFALVKYKKLVGGGAMTIVNQTIPHALAKLGYDPHQSAEIVDFISENNSVIEAPHLLEEHYPVFDTAIGRRAIHHLGHLKMMAAIQPFMSGAISKTVNLPAEVTRQDIFDIYLEAWKMGLKAVAIYRDGTKTAQPLGDGSEDEKAVVSLLGDGLLRGRRRRVPDDGQAIKRRFEINSAISGKVSGHIVVGLFEDGTPGEVFVNVAQAGSTLRGFIDTWSRLFSMALQYGAPLDDLVAKQAFTQFEPSGFTNDQQISRAKSIPDYVVRWMASRFLDPEIHSMLGIKTTGNLEQAEEDQDQSRSESESVHPQIKVSSPVTGPRPVITSPQAGTGICSRCGGMTVQAGQCMTCTSCGDTGGCG